MVIVVLEKQKHKGNSLLNFRIIGEYTITGDDLRRIDWNSYARFEKLYYEGVFWKKNRLLSILFLDSSNSMYQKVKKSIV